MTEKRFEATLSILNHSTFKNESYFMETPLLASRRALALVEIVAGRRDGASFSHLSTELGVASASLSRLLKVLNAESWIRQDEATGNYVAGFRLLQLGDRLQSNSPSIDLISEVVSDLSHATGHSACFTTFRGDYFTLLAKTEQRKSYHFIDTLSPNFDWIGNGMGQFLLAFQSMEICSHIYQKHFRMPVPFEHIRLFAQIRENGYLARNEDFVTRVIAGVATEADQPIENLIAVAALTSSDINVEAMLKTVQLHARRIEQRLIDRGLTFAPRSKYQTNAT